MIMPRMGENPCINAEAFELATKAGKRRHETSTLAVPARCDRRIGRSSLASVLASTLPSIHALQRGWKLQNRLIWP
jgi:hypothetical protein